MVRVTNYLNRINISDPYGVSSKPYNFKWKFLKIKPGYLKVLFQLFQLIRSSRTNKYTN